MKDVEDVVVEVKMPCGKIKECTQHVALYVPDSAERTCSHQEEQGDNLH